LLHSVAEDKLASINVDGLQVFKNIKIIKSGGKGMEKEK